MFNGLSLLPTILFCALFALHGLACADALAISAAPSGTEVANPVTSPEFNPSLEEIAVRERVNAYLDALKLKDLASAYQMESGILDGSLSPLMFRESVVAILPLGATLLAYSITSVEFNKDQVLVSANVIYDWPPMRAPYQTKKIMIWGKRNGTYYRLSPKPAFVNSSSNQSSQSDQPFVPPAAVSGMANPDTPH